MMETHDTGRSMSGLSAVLRLGGGFILSVFAVGVAAGVVSAVREHGRLGLGVAIGVALAVLLLAAGIWLIMSARRHLTMPRSPRVRRSRIAFYGALGISVVAGVATGMIAQMSGGVEQNPVDLFARMFTPTPLGTAVALAAIAAWIGVIAVSVYWHLTLDEIERAEYEFGATLALYAYVSVAPAWWLAWRGGLLPEPGHVTIFFIVCTVWCIGWGWRRYR